MNFHLFHTTYNTSIQSPFNYASSSSNPRPHGHHLRNQREGNKTNEIDNLFNKHQPQTRGDTPPHRMQYGADYESDPSEESDGETPLLIPFEYELNSLFNLFISITTTITSHREGRLIQSDFVNFCYDRLGFKTAAIDRDSFMDSFGTIAQHMNLEAIGAMDSLLIPTEIERAARIITVIESDFIDCPLNQAMFRDGDLRVSDIYDHIKKPLRLPH